MTKSRFASEQEANDYKAKHQLTQRVAVPLAGSSKWGLIFLIDAHLEVRDGAPREESSEPNPARAWTSD